MVQDQHHPGGKLIGFSSNATGRSGSYDRHVYMLNDGRLSFGTGPGSKRDELHRVLQRQQVALPLAQQSSAGMKLYVDTELVGTNPQSRRTGLHRLLAGRRRH